MKRFMYCVLLIAAAACNQGGEKNATVQDSVTRIPDSASAVISDAHYFWEADLTGKALEIKKARVASADSLNPSAILGMLNNEYPELKLELLRSAADTVFIKVGNSEYLTRQLGSTGSEAVLAEITYNLTEAAGIHNVHISFRRGDHATPGTYARTDFIQPQ